MTERNPSECILYRHKCQMRQNGKTAKTKWQMNQDRLNDKEIITKILIAAGYEPDSYMWRLGCADPFSTIGVSSEDGSVGFSFDESGKLIEVWGRDW